MKPGIGLNIMSWGMNSPWWLNHVFVNFNTGQLNPWGQRFHNGDN